MLAQLNLTCVIYYSRYLARLPTLCSDSPQLTYCISPTIKQKPALPPPRPLIPRPDQSTHPCSNHRSIVACSAASPPLLVPTRNRHIIRNALIPPRWCRLLQVRWRCKSRKYGDAEQSCRLQGRRRRPWRRGGREKRTSECFVIGTR